MFVWYVLFLIRTSYSYISTTPLYVLKICKTIQIWHMFQFFRNSPRTRLIFCMHLDASLLECWLILNKNQRQYRALLISCQMPHEWYFCIVSYDMFNVKDNNLTYHSSVIYSSYNFVVFNPFMVNLEHKGWSLQL